MRKKELEAKLVMWEAECDALKEALSSYDNKLSQIRDIVCSEL